MYPKLLIPGLCVLILALAQPLIAADWGVLLVDLGEEDISQGVLLLTNGDGVTEPDDIADKECRVVPETPPGQNTGNHAYFIVDSATVADKEDEENLWIAVEYYDAAEGGATSILMDYDDEGDLYPDQAFALNLPQEGRTINFTHTEEWQIAILAIEQAEFKEQGNGGDFRFHIVPYMSSPFYLNRVWVSNNELTAADLGEAKAVEADGKLSMTWAALKNR